MNILTVFFSCGLSFPAKIVLCQLYDGRSLTRKCVKTATTANRKNRRKTHNHNQYKPRHAGNKKPVSNMPACTDTAPCKTAEQA